MVGRWAGLETRVPARDMESCAQYVVEGIDFDPDAIYLQFGAGIAPGGYAWLFPKSPGVANVGLGLVALKADARNARQYLDAWIARRYPGGAKTACTVGGVIVHTTIRQTYTDGVVVAGDAAHMINPLSGGGIVNAMKAGRLAGCVAAAAGRGGRDGLCRHVASGAEHFLEPARARQDRRLAPHAGRLAAPVREDLSARCDVRYAGRGPGGDSRQQALQGRGRFLNRGARPAPGAGLRRPAARYRGPLARQWSRSQETAARHEPGRLPRRRERQRLFPRFARGPVGTAHPPRWLVPVADVHGERAGGAGVRGRDVLGKGGARKRHPDAGVRGGPKIRGAGEHDLGWAARLTRRERHRENRADGRVLRRQCAAHRAAYRAGSGHDGGVSRESLRQRDYWDDDLRGQGIPRHGGGGGRGGG